MKTFRIKIEVKYKDGILDPQAEAIHAALQTLQLNAAKNVQCQKAFLVEVEASDEADAIRTGKEMGDKLLANAVMEDYEVEIVA